ncbi:MAG TPA: YWFCY domain-containing protein [Puia sp.]
MYNKESFRSAADICLVTGILLLLLHVYFFYYPVFAGLGWEAGILRSGMELIVRTGFFDRAWYSKNLALLLLFLSSWGGPVRKSLEVSFWVSLGIFSGGLLLFLLYMPGVDNWAIASGGDLILYLICTGLAVGAILFGASRFMRSIKVPWPTDDPFGWLRAGFPQEHRLKKNDYSLHLRGKYQWNGVTRECWINLINPRRGIMIMGNPGSGKSRFIIEPLIKQMIEKKWALFIYDFKFDTLSKFAYRQFLANQHLYPSGKFCCINFKDLSRSHRCNVLQPATLNYLSDALGVSKTIFLSMNKSWVQKQNDFFVQSPITLLAALIWYLKKYEGGKYCTLPHAIELSTTPYERLFAILGRDPELAVIIDPFFQAFNNKSTEMLDGQMSSAKISLAPLSSPDLYYLLTGDDFTLDINNPSAPKIFCLGGDAERSEALAPIISLYIDRLNRLCNQPGRYPCALVCDEFATFRSYSMAATVATGRSNNITPILAIQDLSQLRTIYTDDEAYTLLNICGNLLCSQVAGETARWVSDRFPKVLRDRHSVSVGNDTSVTVSQQWEPPVTPAMISTLSSGEFVGITADEPGKELRLKAFHAEIVREEIEEVKNELPIVAPVDKELLIAHYEKVKAEIKLLVAAEYKRITK